jgi:hypothetical protein
VPRNECIRYFVDDDGNVTDVGVFKPRRSKSNDKAKVLKDRDGKYIIKETKPR